MKEWAEDQHPPFTNGYQAASPRKWSRIVNEQSFSSLLEELRLACNLSKTDLARLTNLTPGYISHLTRGERAAPSESVVQNLARALRLEGQDRETFFRTAGYSHTLPAFAGRFSSRQLQKKPETARVSWEDVPNIDKFYGREEEQRCLSRWINEAHCKVVAIIGIGGIGKTSLAAQFVKTVNRQFDVAFWHSLRDMPPLEDVLNDCLQFLSERKGMSLPAEKENWLPLLFEELSHCLSEQRCLLVLDNFESVLQSGQRAGKYLDGYEGYGRLISSIGETSHQSCLILTSREKPREVVHLEGKTAIVRSMSLPGLSEVEGRELISDKGLSGKQDAWASFIKIYSGNPLALKLAAEPILELFGGEINEFLQEKEVVVGDIYELIDRQFQRLSSLEQIVMYWLAIAREAISLEDLRNCILPRVSRKDLFDSLTSLRRRSMIEPQGTARFWLQPVILEYVTNRLVEILTTEITERQPLCLRNLALLNAEAKDEIRNSQMRLLLQAVVQKIGSTSGQEGAKQQLKLLLADLRKTTPPGGDYAMGNLVNLLVQLNHDLSGYDFAGQIIRHAFLPGVVLANTNFAHATFANSIFTDTFGKIMSVAVSPNDRLLAAGSASNEIRLWKFHSLVPIFTLQGHSDWVRGISFSPDSRLLASASEDRTVRLWEVSTGRCLRTLHGHSSLVYGVAFSPDGTLLASCGDDKTICLWEIASGHLRQVLRGHENKVWWVAFNPDSQLLVSGSDDASVRLWEVSSGNCLNVLRGHTSKIWTVAISPDGELIASGSHDQTIRLWEVSSGKCLNVLREHTSWVYTVDFNPDGTLLASGSDDQTLRLWEVSTGQCLKVMGRHTNRVRAVAFGPQGDRLVSGSDDQTLRLWEVSTGQCLNIVQGYSNEVWKAVFSSDGKLLASGSDDQKVRLWEVSSGECVKTLQGHTNRVQTVAFSPDGKLLATGSDDQTARLWDVRTEECLAILQEHNTWIWAVAFSPDGSLLATAGEDQIVRLWEVSTATYTRVLQGHTDWIWSTSFSPDGRFLLTGSDDETARIWEVNSGACMHVLQGHSNRVRSIAFSWDSSLVATGSDDQTVRIWRTDTGACVQVLADHTGWVRAVAFSPDGKLVASGSDDHKVRLWETSTGRCAEVLCEHTNRVRSVEFSPDGFLLASGSQDGKIILWKVQTAEIRQELISRRPYEGANIAGVRGLSLAQKTTLKALGAVERDLS
jgi:WD40 repeat protein/transcriptional regulator with XRE-family HTH domain